MSAIARAAADTPQKRKPRRPRLGAEPLKQQLNDMPLWLRSWYDQWGRWGT